MDLGTIEYQGHTWKVCEFVGEREGMTVHVQSAESAKAYDDLAFAVRDLLWLVGQTEDEGVLEKIDTIWGLLER